MVAQWQKAGTRHAGGPGLEIPSAEEGEKEGLEGG